MPSKELEQFDEVMRRLASQRGPALQLIAFLSDLADNDSRWDKYKGSFSGNVINLHVVTAENALILLCCRIWDKGTDVQSLRRAFGLLRRCETEVTERRRSDIDADFIKNWDHIRKRDLDHISDTYSKLSKHPIHPVLKVMRDENLAHLLSSIKLKAIKFRAGFENHGITRYQLYEFAEASIKLVEKIEHYRTGNAYDFDDSAQLFKTYCESYWKALPIFRDVE